MCQYQVAYSKNGLKVEVDDVLRALRQVSATVRALRLEYDLGGRIVDGCHQNDANHYAQCVQMGSEHKHQRGGECDGTRSSVIMQFVQQLVCISKLEQQQSQ